MRKMSDEEKLIRSVVSLSVRERVVWLLGRLLGKKVQMQPKYAIAYARRRNAK